MCAPAGAVVGHAETGGSLRMVMSDGEILLMGFSLAVAFVSWAMWFLGGWRIRTLGRRGARGPLLNAPVLGFLALWLVLKHWSSSDVRDSGLYTFFYMCLGLAWVGILRGLFPLMDLSVRDDVYERRNSAVSWAVAGGILGLFACYAGANIGDGPGWWVVVACAVLSTGGLFVLWGVTERVLRVSDAITIDRDVASGLRLGAFLLAAGLLLGRAVAGNWVSWDATVKDFIRDGSPAVILLGIAMVIEWLSRPTPTDPEPSVLLKGLLPALLYLGGSALFLSVIGPWT